MIQRVVIHAGLPKCGSTSLQLRLLGARHALAERGIAYPLTERATGRLLFGDAGPEPWAPQHAPLAHALEGEVPPDALVRGLEEAGAAGARTLVLSSESFGPRSLAYSAPAFAPLRRFAVELVVFTRRRDDWMLAMWKQAVRTGRRRYRGSFRRWLAEPPVYDRGTAGLSASAAAARLAAATGGRATVLDLADGADTGALFGRVLGVDLREWPDWSPDRLGTLRGAERRAGLRVNATHGDAAALFLAMADADSLGQADALEVAAAALEWGFGDVAPGLSLVDRALSAVLLAPWAAERDRLGFAPASPRDAAAEVRTTLTVAEWRAMAAALAPRLGPAAAAGLGRAGETVRELA